MNYKLETGAGDHFTNVSERAKELANIYKAVEFDFNGIKCIVDKATNLGWLYRDYNDAHIMEWRVVGPHCLAEYEKEVKEDLANRKKKRQEELENERIESRKKEEKEKKLFNDKVKGVEIELSDKDGWDKTVKVNSEDPYGNATIEYANGWARLMQVEISKGKTVKDCAEKTSYELGFLGITGFMYGCAVSILSQCWVHGEELRKWHNKEYDHDGDGVVNPAILTINT